MRSLACFAFTALLPLGSALAATPGVIDHQRVLPHEEAEARYEAPYKHMATGHLGHFQEDEGRHPWPYDLLSIGHTMASFQSYGWGEPYFHHGLDIRGDAGTPVLAAVGGKVVNVGNYNGGSRYYWEVAILDAEGFLWQYHHVDHESIPQEVKDAFASGGEVPAGQLVGEIVDWPASTYGEIYHHVHLNVIGADGTYLNPFHFMEKLPDESPPEIDAIALLANGKVQQGNSIQGPYSLALEVRDLVLHDKFTVPPYHIEYQVDGGEPVVMWTFDELPGKDSRTAFVEEFYVPSATCGNYRCRQHTLDLGFLKEGSRVFPNTPGSHEVTVTVRDYVGNQDQASFTWEVLPE